MEKKFATENNNNEGDNVNNNNRKALEKYRKFEEFMNDYKELDEKKDSNQNQKDF